MRSLTPKERKLIDSQIKSTEKKLAEIELKADNVCSYLDTLESQIRLARRKIKALQDRLAEDELARGV